MNRRRAVVAALAALALALAGCAGLPTTGPVTPGLEAGAEAGEPDFAFRPDSPQPGATPQEIVDGFIRAGTGPGKDGQWSVAKEYLAQGTRWNPTARVTIDEPGDRVYSSSAEDQVSLTVSHVADVDDIGAYEPSAGEPLKLDFRLAVQPDGEWRITEVPDGLVLDMSQFSSVFQRYALMYFDPTWRFLVPDVRWFPRVNAATYVTDALIDGPPAPWLAASVASAFPDSVSVRPSVPVDSDGVAQVELDASAAELSPDTQSRMQAQLEASLADARVSTVEMTAGTTPLDVEPAATRSTRVSSLAAVQTEQGFGFLNGDEVDPIDGLTPAMRQVDPLAIQVAPDRDFAAVHVTSGSNVRVQADGDVFEFDSRPGLVDPTVDPSGYTWSVPRDAPSTLIAFAAGSEQTPIDNAWPEATRVSSIAMSRDGTRLAAVVTSNGRSAVWVSGVVRKQDGTPSALGEPLLLDSLATENASVAWLDDITVGVLSGIGIEPEVVELTVGGPSAVTPAPAGAAQLAGGNQGTMRVRGAQGALYSKRGSTWPQTGAGILVLATQQGTPQ
ncbi:hypothetical protein G5T42_01310 [Microbacterium sp. 4R-513]|uniref:LpqB family beta-propeller domain-containing protein n=1 Tax=Microbacterium sp. 4R-513 TaxID=2567934 RepID=UPI0013E19BE9|nr:LpqB family beta-propeller domain-containing protein [Microbacterium sp. 4R-513]QIG38282.1 hypothetical protein G5T42_01310 [Microbacterium sp. 4R-513]